MSVISVKGLSKYYKVFEKEPGLGGSLKSLFKREYRQVKAVDEISFNINEGELIGFIGPNGAGKTTTLKCLSGLLYPTAGQVQVLGFTPWERSHAFLKQISLVMGQKNQLWWDLPAIESFILNKEIYEIPETQYNETLTVLVNLLDVKEVLNVQVRRLSLGQRMKCELIAALLHSPKVLFLDEPTIGLDVVMQKKIREFIREYNQKFKATIILTSHYMGDVKELCKRVVIIDRGKIIFDGLLSEITKKYADHKILQVVFSHKVPREKVENIGLVKKWDELSVTLAVKRSQVSKAAAQILENYPVADLNIEEPAIEDIIREVFTGKDVA
ncbi:ABC transporter [Candidatus Beckwithbacteria bacterium RBG_13_42_9]|uniref:ABC transporter n=1 Tax=Candidatus Beckwithbacteria bacterium RBG_13_42_9 TaxID=1797457 RepID=A0A1F5E539_9BACT|nr:MAG: ABC transporter [Candidatus Beckwithbacteria bacterium RBG_13_42_9]